jgi:hypothetical protein
MRVMELTREANRRNEEANRRNGEQNQGAIDSSTLDPPAGDDKCHPAAHSANRMAREDFMENRTPVWMRKTPRQSMASSLTSKGTPQRDDLIDTRDGEAKATRSPRYLLSSRGTPAGMHEKVLRH